MSFVENLRRMQQHLRNYVDKFLGCMFCPLIDVVDEDDCTFEFFGLNVIFLHCALDLLEKPQRGVRWEFFPLEHDWLSIAVVQLTILKRMCEPINSVFPRQITESEKTFAFAVDSLITSSFNKILLTHGIVSPINRGYSMYFM